MNFRKLRFCSVFLSGSVKTILRVKRSFGVIFVKLKKRASAPSSGLISSISLAKISVTRCKKSYSGFHISGNLAAYNLFFSKKLFSASEKNLTIITNG